MMAKDGDHMQAKVPTMSKPVMYIFVNKGLHMTTGKVASQAAHAAVEGFRLSKKDLIDAWYIGKHYTKLVMQARTADHLLHIATYLQERGFKTKLIIDEGMTEIAPHTPTALGVEIVDKDDPHTLATFSSFELYRDTMRVTIETDR